MGHHFSQGPVPGFEDFFTGGKPPKSDSEIAQEAILAAKVAELEKKLKEARVIGLTGLPTEADFGPTGKFPEGKLSDNDEGEIMIGTAVYRGRVLINYGKPIVGVGLTPDQAEEIGRDLIRKANEARL